MKKIIILVLFIFLLVGCSTPSDNPTENPETNNPTTPLVVAADLPSYWDNKYEDTTNEVTRDNLVRSNVFYRGEYLTEEKELKNRYDIKYEFYTEDNLRFVNSSEGYAITLPTTDVKIDYLLSNYRVQLDFGDSILTASMEDSNPYGDTLSSWNIYSTEWLNRYINNPNYLEGYINEELDYSNNLSYTRDVVDSTSVLDGYQVMLYSIVINDNENIERPYYNIAVIRNLNVYNKFFLFVMKSKSNQNEMFDNLLDSFTEFKAFGTSQIFQGQYELKANPKWNDETKAYFEKINNPDTFEFGFFSYSLNDKENLNGEISLKLGNEINRLKSLTDYDQAVLPTYNHLSWYGEEHEFPLNLATEFGGGNGYDDKAVLQFTLQYTTNNNNVNSANTSLDNYTPMFDILRGKYDNQFRELARGIKSYSKPVLFRLNNEMNTDWTSYCGMMTLLDPDIFQYTWIHLYEIFESEGVDNCIWIFNPIAITCPYSSWGEDLCYMPGSDYVQALGITRYEMMNDDVEALSFKEGYTNLYNKNKDYWMNYPWVVSEFGCASGGEDSGELYRNHKAQAEWVSGMFDCLLDKENNEFCRKITVAVWFNCDDVYYDEYGNKVIYNALKLDSSLTLTFEALKNGLKNFD